MIKLIFFLLFISKVYSQQLFVPKNTLNPKGLIVFLHGCKMNGPEFAKTIDIKNYADQYNFVAYFPSQNQTYNPDRCWNWFLPQNQTRITSFENLNLLNEIAQIQKQFNIENSKTYLAGLSSGAAHAMNLISCFPEKFAGIAIHSGLNYMAASNVFEAQEVLLSGPKLTANESARAALKCSNLGHKMHKTLVIHGQADTRVYPINFNSITEHFKELYDILDDGINNSSFPSSFDTSEIITPGRYDFTLNNYLLNQHIIIKTILIETLQHKWSGGANNQTYSDPQGPDVNKLILEFFFE